MRRYPIFLIALCAAMLALTSCGGAGASGTTANNNNQAPPVQQGATFMTAEDTPLPAVLAFNVAVSSVMLNNGTTSVEALAAPATVDFARLIGLRTLLSFNSVPAGTYNSATIKLDTPVISFLDLSTNPPGVGTINGTFAGSATPTSTTVTVALNQAMVVTSNGLAGLHMHFDLRDSIQVDGTGQVTGVVNPQIQLNPVQPTDQDAQITDLRGGLVSVNVAGNAFVIQRPDGKDITIDVNSSTTFSGSNTLASLAPPAVIEVDGQVQNDGSILATDVEVVSIESAFISGRIVNVTPSSGAATSLTILVDEEVPALTGIPVGFPVTIDVSQVQIYDIRHIDNWFTNFLFNNTTLVPGQRVGIGGHLDTSQNPPVLVPKRVMLRRQGVEGNLVSGSVQIVSGNQGTFQIQNGNLFGYVLGAPLDVSTDNKTRFPNINGLTGLQAAGAAKVAVEGLILKDPNTGNPRMYAQGVKVLQ